MRLIDKINHLRSSAAFLFDMGRTKGQSPEEIASSIKPISQALEQAITSASIKEKAMAIKSLEHQIEAFNLDKALIQGKIEDSKDHLQNVKNSLINDLAKKNLESISEEGFFVTLHSGQLTIR